MPQEEEKQAMMGCGVLGRHPILAVLGFAGAGVGIGIGLSYWEVSSKDFVASFLVKI